MSKMFLKSTSKSEYSLPVAVGQVKGHFQPLPTHALLPSFDYGTPRQTRKNTMIGLVSISLYRYFPFDGKSGSLKNCGAEMISLNI